MGEVQFGFCVAPHHPLAVLGRPLEADDISAYCAVVVADTSRHLPPLTRGLLSRQPLIVMPTMQAKIDAQVRGLGCGYLPLTLAAPYIMRGELVQCAIGDGVPMTAKLAYAWREDRKSTRLNSSH